MPEDAEIFGEADGDRRNRAGLDDEKERPAVEEAPERREGFAQVNVLPARLRHHRGEFAVGERRHEREQTCDDPDDEQPTGCADLPRDVGGDDEDAGADHRTGDDHRRIEQTKPAYEACPFVLSVLGDQSRVRHSGSVAPLASSRC